jgi:excinuclease ABC subunit B
VYLAYGDYAYRIIFWGDEIEHIDIFLPFSNDIIDSPQSVSIYPANIFITPKERLHQAIKDIQADLVHQQNFFLKHGKEVEAKRIKQRIEHDLEQIKEFGYCPGIENYSRYFDGRAAGSRPFCLLDYFPKNFLTFIDESHVTIPQIQAMFGGDHSRKHNLVGYGFRLPSAIDNRPLKFEEFEKLVGQTLFVSATPAAYELEMADGIVVEQVIRPTGLLDPVIEVRSPENQIDNLVEEIEARIKKGDRTFVTTLTKRMAEELWKYFKTLNIRCRYMHSDVETLERVEILSQLQQGIFDVLIGVNLLREGLDIPEVSLVAILDADKEGFLRSTRSLTQTAGRAARHLDGKVIMYAERITKSMRETIEETERRREKQISHNEKYGITPKQVLKVQAIEIARKEDETKDRRKSSYDRPRRKNIAAEPIVKYMSDSELEAAIEKAHNNMVEALRNFNFDGASLYQDEEARLIKVLNKGKK